MHFPASLDEKSLYLSFDDFNDNGLHRAFLARNPSETTLKLSVVVR